MSNESEGEADLNKLLVPMFLAIIFSLLSTQSLANADIKVTSPSNWQPDPINNNYDLMWWYQNSTKSSFAINKAPDNMPFPLFFAGPIMAQGFAEKGVLESADQISFGHSNYGYRYFLNLSSPSKLVNSSSGSTQLGGFSFKIGEGHDVPFKGMLILTEKQGDLYAILLLSPRENFDSILNQIKPTLDSIQLSNSTAPWNSTAMLN
jgi:hypothetical protein